MYIFFLVELSELFGEKENMETSQKNNRSLPFNRKSLKMLNIRQKLNISKMAKKKQTTNHKQAGHLKSPIRIKQNKILSVVVEKLDISNLQAYKTKPVKKKTKEKKNSVCEGIGSVKNNIKTAKLESPKKKLCPRVKCDVCGITVSSKSYLTIHQRIHLSLIHI